MKQFASLISTLDATTKTTVKVEALRQYFENTSHDDVMWTVALLAHRRPRRTVTTTQLRLWAASFAEVPIWLFEECYHIVGDLAETIALLTPSPIEQHQKSLSFWINFIRDLKDKEDEEKEDKIRWAWQGLDQTERFVFNKLITGGWRIGVSQKLMMRALHKYTGIEENILAHRLMGEWSPDTDTLESLILSPSEGDNASRPYPFYLTYALDLPVDSIGNPTDWSAEYKWDGIRGQLIKRDDQLFVWSRGEELVTDKYPEYSFFAEALPNGTVIDGEILPVKDGEVLPFGQLQRRIGRKKVGKKLLSEVPVVLMAYDLLEYDGVDIRREPFSKRRDLLSSLIDRVNHPGLLLSPILAFDTWDELGEKRSIARSYLAEGVMLKKRSSIYDVGRKKGEWWKWKLDPFTIDAVMLYAQRGHGRRANLYTDFTFAVWSDDTLVTFAKAYSGLTETEFEEVNRFIRANTIDRFGPVRAVKPELVFELAFEGIQRSSRHKSGIALRFPRISRWRRDKKASEANTLSDLHNLLDQYGQ